MSKQKKENISISIHVKKGISGVLNQENILISICTDIAFLKKGYLANEKQFIKRTELKTAVYEIK